MLLIVLSAGIEGNWKKVQLPSTLSTQDNHDLHDGEPTQTHALGE